MNDGQKNAKLLVKRLTAARLTLSSAESCTGGLIAKLITDVAGSSAVFAGGCVTYTNEVKHALLGVEQQIFDQYTEVSEPCAKAMAAGVRAKLNTHIGVSTTGYAGPGGGTEKDPVGTVYIAVATPERTVCRRIQAPKGSTRGQVRHLAATIAIRMIAEELN